MLWVIRPATSSTEDRNRDGRPDLWRSYDRFGALSEIRRDTNFDGRIDVQEFYERGTLVRREVDRDFNRAVDLVEYFDAATGGEVRSIADVDGDSVADIQVSFANGVVVHTRHALAGSRARFSSHHSGAALAPLGDPFADEPALKAGSIKSLDDSLAASALLLVPESRGQPLQADRSPIAVSTSSHLQVPAFAVPALRGPPALRHLI